MQKMREYIAIFAIVLLLPYVATMLYQGKSGIRETAVPYISGNQAEKESPNDEELLIGMLAAAIPINYPQETLKAQAVILRTQLEGKAENGKAYSAEEMKELWGTEAFADYYARLKTAVEETQGMILTYDGETAYAPYHAVSAGYTRSSDSLFAKGEYPYLKSVECKTDIEAEGYLTIEYRTIEEFTEKVNTSFPSCQLSKNSLFMELQIKKTDKAGYVETIVVGTQELSGEEFRRAMGFPSACFVIEAYEENVRIVTKGLGHGLGFDQYYAKRLAEDGKQMTEILNYFFEGAIITQK